MESTRSSSFFVVSFLGCRSGGVLVHQLYLLIFIHDADIVVDEKDGASKFSEADAALPSTTPASAAPPSSIVAPLSSTATSAPPPSTTVASAALPQNAGDQIMVSASFAETERAPSASSPLPEGESTSGPNLPSSSENYEILSATSHLLRCNSTVENSSNPDALDGADPAS